MSRTRFNRQPPRPARRGAEPSPRLTRFLVETLAAVQAGAIGPQTALTMVRSWPATTTADHLAKIQTVRRLSLMVQ